LPLRPTARHDGPRPRRRPARQGRARSHCRFVLPLIHFITYSLTYSASIYLKRNDNATEPYAKGTETRAAVNADEQSLPLGLLLVAVGCCCSAFAGVYFEKMMKTGTPSHGP
jgi:hypothetical protein